MKLGLALVVAVCSLACASQDRMGALIDRGSGGDHALGLNLTGSTEMLFLSLPPDYVLGAQNHTDRLKHLELIPRGQTVESWDEMLTLQIFGGGVPQGSPQAYYETFAETWRRACPSAESRLPLTGEQNGYPFGTAVFSCARNPATSKPEWMTFKAVQGSDAFYLVQKAWRRQPNADEVDRWAGFLAAVQVCDRNPETGHACPRGIGPTR